MDNEISPWWLLLSFGIRLLWGWGTASKAEEKGRSPIWGALAGFFLGIIGFAIYYFLPAVEGGGESNRRVLGGTETKRQQFGEAPAGTCRVCGYANAVRESRCYQCGNMLA
jgi:hypothetical protein